MYVYVCLLLVAIILFFSFFSLSLSQSVFLSFRSLHFSFSIVFALRSYLCVSFKRYILKGAKVFATEEKRKEKSRQHFSVSFRLQILFYDVVRK